MDCLFSQFIIIIKKKNLIGRKNGKNAHDFTVTFDNSFGCDF